MTAGFSMLNGIFSYIGDFLTGIFAFIPQMMYFVYTCAASLMDVLQYLVRKLAGLDVYYVNGQRQEGDIILSIIKGILGIETDTSGAYSTLSTAFWSMIIFAAVLLVLSTIIKMITTHYNYNPDNSHPMAIIRSALKSLATIAIIPIVSIFGIQITNVLLKTIDQISSGSSSATIATVYKNSAQDYKNVFESGEDNWGYKTYSSYDFFTFGAYTNTTTISGQLFLVSANSGNRVRKGTYTPHPDGSGDMWSNHGIFSSSVSDEDTRREEVAYMIDYAFANHLTLKQRKTSSILMGESSVLISSFTYLQSAVWYLGTIQFKTFSKYNVGLVWYYYNLWGFNFFIAFAGLSVSMTLLMNIVFGLITRLINVLALFMVYPVLLGIHPLDEGKAFSSWKSEYVGNLLMTYGAIVGMNLVFMILPMLQNISFFNSRLPDLIFNMVIMIAALLSIKKIIQTFSQLVGSKDANVEGESTKEESKKIAFAAAEKAAKIAQIAVKVGAVITTGGASLALEAAKEIAKKKAKDEIIKRTMQKVQEKKKKELLEQSKKMQKEQQEEAKEQKNENAKGQNDEESTPRENTQTENQGGNETQQENHITEKQEVSSAEDSEGDQGDESGNESEDDGAIDKLAIYASKFRDMLGKEGSGEDFGVDQELANNTKKWYDEQIKSMKESRERASKQPLSDSEMEELSDQVKDMATERFMRDSAETESALNNASQELKAEKKQKWANKHPLLKKVSGAARTAGSGLARAGGGIKSMLEDSGITEVAAESLKVIGHLSGVSSILKKQLSEAGVLDAGLQTIHEFAQTVGISSDKIPTTKKGKEKAAEEMKTREAKAKGEIQSYSQAVAMQLEQIVKLAGSLNEQHKK